MLKSAVSIDASYHESIDDAFEKLKVSETAQLSNPELCNSVIDFVAIKLKIAKTSADFVVLKYILGSNLTDKIKTSSTHLDKEEKTKSMMNEYIKRNISLFGGLGPSNHMKPGTTVLSDLVDDVTKYTVLKYKHHSVYLRKEVKKVSIGDAGDLEISDKLTGADVTNFAELILMIMPWLSAVRVLASTDCDAKYGDCGSEYISRLALVYVDYGLKAAVMYDMTFRQNLEKRCRLISEAKSIVVLKLICNAFDEEAHAKAVCEGNTKVNDNIKVVEAGHGHGVVNGVVNGIGIKVGGNKVHVPGVGIKMCRYGIRECNDLKRKRCPFPPEFHVGYVVKRNEWQNKSAGWR